MTDQRAAHRRLGALTGLRAIAAGLVLAFHLLDPACAGYIGVDIFFVLSGFLITALLMRERAASGKIDVGAFWVRRSRRLLPGVIITVLGAAALASLGAPEARVDLAGQVFGSLTGTYNWLEIARGGSYFDAANPRLLTMMWSLSVEQQFYLVWPLVLLALWRWRAPAARIVLALALAGASAGWHYVLAGDQTRAYLGTDSHLWGLMFGAALAFALPGALGGRKRASRPASWAWGIAGWAGLCGALWIGAVARDGAWLHPWGMVAAAACALPIIRAVLPDVAGVGPARLLSEALSARPLTWLGERSYGIYLWHWPLATLAYYAAPTLAMAISAPAIAAASIFLADLSYRLIEQPVIRLGWRGALSAWRSRIARSSAPTAICRAVGPLAVACLATWAMIAAPTMTTAERMILQAQVSQGQEGGGEPGPVDPAPQPSPTASSAAPSTSGAHVPAAESTPRPGAEERKPAPEPASSLPEPAGRVRGAEVTIIGDSVTLAARPALEEALPGVAVDAEVSRSVRAAPEILSALKDSGELRPYVVIALATNGTIRPTDVEAILTAIGPDRALILVTGFGTSRTTWIGEANEQIARAAATHPDRVRVADWAGAIRDHTDLLAGDSIHPGPAASRIFAGSIISALESLPRPRGAAAPQAHG